LGSQGTLLKPGGFAHQPDAVPDTSHIVGLKAENGVGKGGRAFNMGTTWSARQGVLHKACQEKNENRFP
jgi:hypothetical protein